MDILANPAHPKPEAALQGFSHVRRFWDAPRGRFVAKILPGQYYVTKNSEAIATILGSCISVCISDPNIGIGGMNHFLLPGGNAASVHDEIIGQAPCARYGIHAMDMLIQDLIYHGADRRNLEVKVTGGGKLMSASSDIGDHNIAFVREYLAINKLSIHAEDVGDSFPRKVLYFPDTGRLLIKKLRDTSLDHICRREDKFLHKIECPE
ncbi:chemoreceptor glutamine deamidase CheD [Pontibacterium sp. N1Y112]|uniref:Probable chemoreceptor glutamine deamidase CheD n=1 Tax=Pontibacterium sinense TaxID=2781979 RepID=A0A8J7FDM0_9GAMM|nr:chemoreceptor glutamine deamidase CheD [Pontibacterium sinense]MBE9397746.1 chemoreceptor glutamine deamidase CheD [Pontibacterium sinense]